MKKKIFLLIALVLCMVLMVGVLAACNEGGTTGTDGDNTQGGTTGGDDEQGGNTPGGDDENQGGNTPGGNPGGWDPDDFPWGSGDDDDDDQGGDFPWNPGGDDDGPVVSDGDVIFTEDASLAEILAALENAESFTCEANAINSTVSDGAIVSEINNIIQVSENAMYINSTTKSDGTIGVYECAAFTEEGVFYKIANEGTEMSKEKNLLSNSDPVSDEYIILLSDFLTEENGKIVLNPEVAEGEYDIYLRLEGDRLVIGFSRIYNSEKETIEYVWSKVNATDVVIPEELKELAYDADWADYVHYNGVSYQKAEDEYGEYYRVYSVQDGAVPEETINGLPVR